MTPIIQNGAVMTIDANFTEAVETALDRGQITRRDFEEWCSAIYIEWLPITIKFQAFRHDRERVFLGWSIFHPAYGRPLNFNLNVFKALGYEFNYPPQTELSIYEADERLLTERELILKTIVENKGGVNCCGMEAWCESILRTVEDAMKEKGIVFYTP
jgi:hypothetical protein